MLAVVVRFQEGMPPGEQDTLHRRQGGIAEEELPLSVTGFQVQRVGIWILDSPAAQVGGLDAFRRYIQSLPVQPIDHFLQQN